MVAGRRHLILLLILFVPSFGLCAQSTEAAAHGRRVMLYVDQAAGGPLRSDELFMLSRSILLTVQSAIPAVRFDEEDSGSIPSASEEQLAQKASGSGADFWIWTQVSSSGAGLRLRVRGFDLLAQRAAFDRTLERDPFSAASLPFEPWNDLVQLVGPTLNAAAASTADVPQPHEAVLSLRAEPGTVVTGPNGSNAVAGSDGLAVLRLTAPAEYSLRSTRAGFYPDTTRLFLGGDRDLALHQVRASRWALDFSLLQIAYPGVDGSFFIVPNWVYAKLGLTTYLVGLAFTSTQVVTSNPLTNVVLQAGAYLRREDVVFRPYVNVGAFLRFVSAPGAYVGIDPVSWGGLQAALGTEIGSNPRGRFFLEFQPMLYASSIPGLLQASFGNGDQPMGWFFGPRGALDLLCFRFGYRWML